MPAQLKPAKLVLYSVAEPAGSTVEPAALAAGVFLSAGARTPAANG